MAVVEAFDVFEDRVGEFDVGLLALPVEEFGLHAAPERFGDGVGSYEITARSARTSDEGGAAW